MDNIPTYIIQGRHDMVCPSAFAVEVAERLQSAILFLADAGHSAREAKIAALFQSVLKEIANNYSQ